MIFQLIGCATIQAGGVVRIGNGEVKMCGRFTITIDADSLQMAFDLESAPPDWKPRYNAAPTQMVGVIREGPSRLVEWMRWGLVPFWAKDPSVGSQLINARAETAAEKPSFRRAFQSQRCLIPADGFFEWKQEEGQKGPRQPYYFRMRDGRPFAFAGLWERWQPEGAAEPLLSCTILTCAPNALLAQYHNRMPVLLRGEAMGGWLHGDSRAGLEALLRPYPAEEMTAYAVSRLVNRASVDTAACIQKVEEAA